MNYRILILLFSISLFTGIPSFAEEVAGLSLPEMPLVPSAGIGYGVGIFFGICLIFLTLILWIGADIILALLGMMAMVLLVSMGIISTSIMVGLNKKSFESGFKTFILLSAAIGGTCICTTGFWLLNALLGWVSTTAAVLMGAVFGLVSGLVFGYALYYLIRGVTNYYKRKFQLTGRI